MALVLHHVKSGIETPPGNTGSILGRKYIICFPRCANSQALQYGGKQDDGADREDLIVENYKAKSLQTRLLRFVMF